jgi:ribonuclease HI
MELTALFEALKLVKKKNVIIISDSKYVINVFAIWIYNWEKNDWKKKDGKKIQNLELIKQIYDLTKKLSMNYIHINSHLSKRDVIENYGLESLEYQVWKGNFIADLFADTDKKYKEF